MAPTKEVITKEILKIRRGKTVKASANMKLYYKQNKEDNAVVLGAAFNATANSHLPSSYKKGNLV